jgi:hypothetical protein
MDLFEIMLGTVYELGLCDEFKMRIYRKKRIHKGCGHCVKGEYMRVLFFLSLNALERRSGTFLRRIFKVLTHSNHLSSRGRYAIFWHINTIQYNKLNNIPV